MRQNAISIRGKDRTTKSKIIFIDPLTFKHKSLETYQSPEHCKLVLPKYIAKYSALIGRELSSQNFIIECLDKSIRVDKIQFLQISIWQVWLILVLAGYLIKMSSKGTLSSIRSISKQASLVSRHFHQNTKI